MTEFSPNQDLLFISADQIKGSTPWRLMDYERNGALSADQIDYIASRLNIDREFINSVSVSLAFVLNPSFYPLVIHMSRRSATDRANKQIEKALAETTVATRKLKLAVERLSPLYTGSSLSADGALRFEKLKGAIAETHRQSEKDLRELLALAKIPDVALVINYSQKGQMPDLRRNLVMRTLFSHWQESGRKLTYTTNSIKRQQRTGPLVEFVHAVVTCITDPPTTLSGETIVSDLRAFLALKSIDDSVLDNSISTGQHT